MKAKKLVLLLDAIVVAIIAMVMITGTAITKTGVAKKSPRNNIWRNHASNKYRYTINFNPKMWQPLHFDSID